MAYANGSVRPVVIGLEVHLQLKTKSKLFCSCSTDYIGKKPNSCVCPICLAVPGTLPVLNDEAVMLAIRMGLGFSCRIQNNSGFHRKHYFYADLPKAYQITQYEQAICMEGHLDIDVEGRHKRVRLNHLHLEEDAGKLVHPTSDGRLGGATYSLVDYDRGGVPLAEVVSEPDLSSPLEAREYVAELRRLARYLDVSDGEMESGSLRVDANISLSNPDGSLGTRVEIKNMNSLKALERALEYEIARQNEVLDAGGALVQETRMWDDSAGVTRSMRSKESARDYRYYPETDLGPIAVDMERVDRMRASMPERPFCKKRRFLEQYGMSREEAGILTEVKELAEYFEEVVKNGAPASRAVNWIKGDVLRVLNEQSLSIAQFGVAPEMLAELIAEVEKKELSTTMAKDVFDILAQQKEGPLTLEEAKKRCGVTGGRLTGDALRAKIQEVLDSSGDVVETIRSGQDKKGAKVKYLQGLVMKASRGQADMGEVSSLLDKMLGG